jgi:hypothetical protein
MALRLVADAAPDTLLPGFRHFAFEPDLLARLVLNDELRRRLSVWALSLRTAGRTGPLILAGAVGAGRTTAPRCSARTRSAASRRQNREASAVRRAPSSE